jgi:polygalacturonase
MKTHLTLKSFSNLPIEEIAGGISNQQPPNYPTSFSQSVGPGRTDAQARQSDAMKSENGILHRHEAPSILSWNHKGLND